MHQQFDDLNDINRGLEDENMDIKEKFAVLLKENMHLKQQVQTLNGPSTVVKEEMERRGIKQGPNRPISSKEQKRGSDMKHSQSP